MNAEDASFDIFFSYARADNVDGRIDELVAAIEKEYASFFPDRQLQVFFDTQVIENGEDWRNRLYSSLKRSRIMVSLLSENYLSSLWCRREWQAWCEIERSRGWLSYMLCPIYYVEVPDSGRRVEAFARQREEFARQIAAYSHGGGDDIDEEREEEDECLAELSSRQTVDLKPWYADGQDALRHEEIRRRLEGLTRTLGEKIILARQAELGEGEFIRANKNFCGRIYELKHIRQCFAEREKGIVPVLHGLGGEGKSALAVAYAHAFAYDYPGGRFLVNCEGLTDIRQCFTALGEQCGIEFSTNANGTSESALIAGHREAWGWLSNRPRGRVLVVLDNIDCPALLSQSSLVNGIRPVDSVHVMIATRCDKNSIGAAGLPIQVGSLSLADGKRLLSLLRPYGDDEAVHAAALVKHLGGHALSLELAGAFLRMNEELSFKEYAEALARDMLPVLEETRAEALGHLDYASTRLQQVDLLVSPTLEGLTALENLALILAALMSPEGVLDTWVRDALVRLEPEAMRKKGLVDPWNRLLKKLTGLCLLQDTGLIGVLRMHRLVREVVLSRHLQGRGRETLRDKILLLDAIALGEARAMADGGVSWPMHYFVALPAAIAGWIADGFLVDKVLELPQLLLNHIIKWTGRTKDSELLVRTAQEAIAGMLPGPEKDAVIASYQVMEGHLLQARGLHQAAYDCYSSAYELGKKLPGSASGKRRMEQIHRLDYMGSSKDSQGDAEAALRLHQKALSVLEALRQTPPRDMKPHEVEREMGYTLEYLVITLSAFTDVAHQEEALAGSMRLLLLRKRLWEADRENSVLKRDYSLALDRVGDALKILGKPDEALDRYEESLRLVEELHRQDPLSASHQRDLSVSQNKMGDILLALGNPEKALAYYEEGLKIRQALAEREKEQSVFWYDYSYSNLRIGDVLMQLGRASEALVHYQTARRIRKRLIAREPGNRRFRFGEAAVYEKLSDAHKALGNERKAGEALKASIDIVHELLREAEPASPRRGMLEEALLELQNGLRQ